MELSYSSTEEQDEETLKEFSDNFIKRRKHIAVLEKDLGQAFISVWEDDGDKYVRIYSSKGNLKIAKDWINNLNSESSIIQERPF